MASSRRWFLKFSLVAGLMTGLGILFKRKGVPPPPETHSSSLRETLGAFLDTLIPADESPSATQLGVTDKIMPLLAKNPRFTELVTEGCRWLDDQAQQRQGRNFFLLSNPAREEVVELASRSAPGSLPRRFFDQLRANGFFYYYANPQSWASLDYEGPPQPRGFPEYTQAPTHGG